MSRRRKLKAAPASAPKHESLQSRNYDDGSTVRYKYRIRGPQSPIRTYTVDDLPPDSALRSPP